MNEREWGGLDDRAAPDSAACCPGHGKTAVHPPRGSLGAPISFLAAGLSLFLCSLFWLLVLSGLAGGERIQGQPNPSGSLISLVRPGPPRTLKVSLNSAPIRSEPAQRPIPQTRRHMAKSGLPSPRYSPSLSQAPAIPLAQAEPALEIPAQQGAGTSDNTLPGSGENQTGQDGSPILDAARHEQNASNNEPATEPAQAVLSRLALDQAISRWLVYPEAARRRGLEGTAIYRILINPDGTLARNELIGTTGSELLDQAALKALRRAFPIMPPPGALVELSYRIVFRLN